VTGEPFFPSAWKRLSENFLGFRKLAGEVIFLEVGQPPTHDQPTPEPAHVFRPGPVPPPPSFFKVMEIEKKDREGKDVQPNLKHVFESIKSSHDLVDRGLHFFWRHRFVGNKERKVSIVVFPSEVFLGINSVLLLEPVGQFRAGQRNRQHYLHGVNPCLFDEPPEVADPFVGRHFKIHAFLEGITENEHSVDHKARLVISSG